MRETRPSTGNIAAPQQASPVERGFTEEMHRRADQLIGGNARPGGKQTLAEHVQREQRERRNTELEMAQLRARAVQARRLAEHIEGLAASPDQPQWAQPARAGTNDRDEQTASQVRHTSDTHTPSSGTMNFNPLHPSMELPPEQLIRLLGLQTRKRKKPDRPKPGGAGTNPAAGTAAVASTKNIPARDGPQKTNSPPVSDEPRRRSLLLPSVISGILLGAGVSAWLFLGTPQTPEVTTKAPPVAAPVTKPASASPVLLP